MTRLYSLNPKSRLKAQMLEIAETWEGHKSLAVQYLLAWKAKK
jgi:3-methyladenine DNA glycosylase/8-oxoguanine DNA glycosylase